MALKLYAVPASHPCACAEAALRLKGLAYERIDLLPGYHVLHQRVRFGSRTVPALIGDGLRVVGSRGIVRALEGMVPRPPLFPADSDARARVEEAEAWGDEVLQYGARRIAWGVLKRRPDVAGSYLEGARLPIPNAVAARGLPLIMPFELLLHRASDRAVDADLRALPEWLDRVDAWIAEGVLGGDEPNAADLQIGSSMRLLLTIGDIAPKLDGRPCGDLGRRLFPDYRGAAPAGVLPAVS